MTGAVGGCSSQFNIRRWPWMVPKLWLLPRPDIYGSNGSSRLDLKSKIETLTVPSLLLFLGTTGQCSSGFSVSRWGGYKHHQGWELSDPWKSLPSEGCVVSASLVQLFHKGIANFLFPSHSFAVLGQVLRYFASVLSAAPGCTHGASASLVWWAGGFAADISDWVFGTASWH